MHPNITQALAHLKEANYTGYFEEMDNVVPANLRPLYNELKGKFMAGKQEWNFDQQLRTFAKQAQDQLDGKIPPTAQTHAIYLTSSPLNNLFIGREEKLQEIETVFSTQHNAVLVSGLGGIGKTSVAREYLKQNAHKYQHIAWIEQTSTLTNAFLLDNVLQTNLGLHLTNEDESYKFKAILNKLYNLTGNNLLLIDNYAEKVEDKALNPLSLFEFPPHWKILITSREKIPQFQAIPLGVLPEAEAIELFKTHCPRKTIADAELKLLLQVIGYHTLTIELLAKNYDQSWDLNSIAELTQLLQERAIDAQALQEKVFTDHSKEEVQLYGYLLRIFDMAKLDEQAIWLLKQFAVLPPIPIAGKTILEWIGADIQTYKPILQDLAKKGWLTSADGRDFEMHRLIQILIVKTQEPTYADCENLIQQIVAILDYRENQVNAKEKLGVVEYGENLLQKLNFEQIENEKSVLQNVLALTYQVFGQYDKARDLLELALASDLQNFGENYPAVALSQSNLATVYRDLGQYEKAQGLLEPALAYNLQNLGEAHPDVARCQSNLGLVYKDLKQYEKARKLLELALTSALQNFGETSFIVFIYRSNLASVYQDLKQYEKALDLLKLALALASQNFEKIHPNVVTCQFILASVYQNLEQYEKARNLLESVLDLYLQNFGENHPYVASCQNSLAYVYFELKNLSKSRELFENAYQIWVKTLGKTHPKTQTAKESLYHVTYLLQSQEKG